MRWVSVALFLGIFVFGALAMGSKEPQELTGTVAVKGNAPFTTLCLVEDNGRTWKLIGDLVVELKNLQNQRVTVEVVEIPDYPKTPGPTPPAVEITAIRR